MTNVTNSTDTRNIFEEEEFEPGVSKIDKSENFFYAEVEKVDAEKEIISPYKTLRDPDPGAKDEVPGAKLSGTSPS